MILADTIFYNVFCLCTLFLIVALFIFSYTICALPGDYVTYLNMIKEMNMGPLLITSAKFILAYPLAYHALNGARHLVRDQTFAALVLFSSFDCLVCSCSV